MKTVHQPQPLGVHLPHRFYPDYFQSGGLGFYEYFLLSEEMGAEPLPVVNVGLVCQYQNNNLKAHVPVDSLDEYIRDAVDLVGGLPTELPTPSGVPCAPKWAIPNPSISNTSA